MKKHLKKAIKATGLMFLLFAWSSIIIVLFNIDYNNFSNLEKILFSLISDIIFLGIVIFSYFKTIKKDFKEFFSDFFNNIEISFKYWFIGFLIMIFSNIIITLVNNGGIANNEEAIRELIQIAPYYMIFSIVIYAPFTEELIFRKGFKDIFKSKWLYIIISGFTFGALHVLGSVTSYMDLLYLIPYCSLGICFAYTYYKTDNIFSTICMHMFHNSMALILYFIGNLL